MKYRARRLSKSNKISLIVLTLSLIIIASSVTTVLNNGVNPIRRVYELPATELGGKDWEEIFANNSSIDEFKVLKTGEVKIPRSGALNAEKLGNETGTKEQFWVDVFVFMFHHKGMGWYMIDTGLDSTYQQEGNIKGFLASNYIIQSKQKSGQNISSQLQRENKEIQGIFFTHLHGDHTAGMPEIDRSIPKYVGKGDEYLDIPFLYHSNHLTSKSMLYEMDWSQGFSKKPFERVIDIFGDGSFLGIHTPGHSKGHLSYLLNTTEGTVLLTGDASHTKYGFLNNIEPGWVHDQKAAENSLNQLRLFHNMFPDVKIIYGHER